MIVNMLGFGILSVLLTTTNSFITNPNRIVNLSRKIFSSTVDAEIKPWQREVDEILNIDTSCDNRREKIGNLLSKSSDILEDVMSAFRDKDIKKVAPPSLSYGKAVEGIQAVQRQIFSDLIPEILFEEAPKILQDTPKRISDLIADGPQLVTKIVNRGQDFAEIAQDPSRLQSTLDEVRREFKNVVKTTPEGLQTPEYAVIKKTSSYEIRKYNSYSVCSTELESEEKSMSTLSPFVTGQGFGKLVDYIFGKGLSMTTPVIITSGNMEFVLPSGLTSSTAPTADSATVTFKDITSEIVAVREFPGIATDGEVMRQRASLEDSLLADGIVYDNLSFRVLQYNPPYTLPWLRRNEVSLVLTGYEIPPSADVSGDKPTSEFQSEDASNFFSAPEAGD